MYLTKHLVFFSLQATAVDRCVKAVCLCNYADNCSFFYNAFQPFMARCTQTDFLPSNYAFGIMTAERPLTMFLVDQIIMAKHDPIFGLTQLDPNYDLKWVGSSRSEICTLSVLRIFVHSVFLSVFLLKIVQLKFFCEIAIYRPRLFVI